MAAAKSLTPTELERVLRYIAENTNAHRNRVMLMCTVVAGMRVSEVAGLVIGDVRNADGTIRSEVFLSAERVKHNHARTVYINTRLQQELAEYIAHRCTAIVQHLSRYTPCIQCQHHDTALPLLVQTCWRKRCQQSQRPQDILNKSCQSGHQCVCVGKFGWTPQHHNHTEICDRQRRHEQTCS